MCGEDAASKVEAQVGIPVDAQGKPLDSLLRLDRWFRSHKNPRKAPWIDPVSAK